jgi:hypothetical protein
MSLSGEVASSRGLRANRRATVRYRCGPATQGKIARSDDQEFQRAWILDLSVIGIGLEASRPVEPGELVVVHLKSQTRTYQLSAHVIHATEKPDGTWLIGCELANRLTEPELEDLLE